jgi:hypothetical protein
VVTTRAAAAHLVDVTRTPAAVNAESGAALITLVGAVVLTLLVIRDP